MYLFNQVRRALPSARDLAKVEPHDWRLPAASVYSPSRPGGRQTLIPHPQLLANAFIPGEPRPGDLTTALAYPDTSHVAVHLALLECFRHLRLGAVGLDVEVDHPPEYEEKPSAESAAAKTRLDDEDQRWDLLLRLAADRFAAWWSNIDSVLNHASVYTHHAGDRVAVQLAKDYIPPLDVILVWYAFMLNGDAYAAMCREREAQSPRITKLCFPWPAIRDSIDVDTMRFKLSSPAQILFSTLSGQSADIFEYLEGPPAFADPDALPAGIDLFAEVKKQEGFIDEAHSLLWIRAPSLRGSLTRAIEDYFDFQLSGTATSNIEVDLPFGINLVWRTHLLFPRQYGWFLQEIGSGEDEKGATRGSGGFDTEYGEVVSRGCYCWVCERVRDDVPDFVHPPASDSPALTPSSSSSSLTPSSPPPDHQTQLSSLKSDQIRQIVDDLGFYSAVEQARREGKPLPTRPPTDAEKEAEKASRDRQADLGFRPGLDEFFEILPDGRRKIRRRKYAVPFSGLPV